DPRLALPVAAYEKASGAQSLRTLAGLKGERRDHRIAFFALDRAVKGTVAVSEAGDGGLRVGEPATGGPLFFALPAGAKGPPATTVPLYEFVSSDGKRRVYSAEGPGPGPGFRRAERPLCLVWRCPTRVMPPE